MRSRAIVVATIIVSVREGLLNTTVCGRPQINSCPFSAIFIAYLLRTTMPHNSPYISVLIPLDKFDTVLNLDL